MGKENLTWVSAIVPVYNAEKTLLRAVESLLIQPEINEIILIEDGSEDESLKVCKDLVSKFRNIQLFTHPDGKNKGAPASRNLGLKKATNTWVQFLDSDDQLLHGKIKSQLEYINHETCLVIGAFLKIEQDSEVRVNYLEDFWSGLISTRLGTTSSILWNSEFINKVGGWDENLRNVQEYYLMFEILKLTDKLAYDPNILTIVYSQPDSITNSIHNFLEKRDNYFKYRHLVRNHLITSKKYSLMRKHYYTICTGLMLKYHRPPFPVPFNNLYFSLYQRMKSIKPILSIRFRNKSSKFERIKALTNEA